MFRNGLLVFSLSVSAWAVSAFAQQAPAVAALDGAPFHNTAAELQQASASVPYDHKSYVTILLDSSLYRFAADGTMHFERRTVYRIENQAGLESWSEAAMQWEPWYEKPSEIHARVLRPDGTFAELDQKTITDAPINGDSTDTYSSAHVRRAPLPGAAIGAIVEKVSALDERRPYFAAGAAYRYAFGGANATTREVVTVELPTGLPLHEAVTNRPGQLPVHREEQTSAGMHRIIFSRAGLAEADHDSDIDLWSSTPIHSSVEFSTGENWKSVSAEYAKMAEPQIVMDDVRGLLPASILTDTPEHRLETIRAIVQKLHTDIRYTGVEFDEAALTPQRPAEVIKRHYGDCKDKAAMLVAMLRAAGIPAHLALLNAGDSIDVNAETPGMNRFNHAIVYVPGVKGGKPLWIDATAEFNTVGTLPYADRDRRALIIAPETTALTMIPDATSADSTLVETRTYVVSEEGPSHVVEESRTYGEMDASYRSLYGGTDTKKMKDDLEGYVKAQYEAKALTRLDHGDGKDLLHPFKLVLTMDEARRAQASLTDAAVAVFPRQVLNSLPKWFLTADNALGPDATEDQKQDRAKAIASRADLYRFHPFQATQITRMIVPAGFDLRSLPKDTTTQLGTGTLTEKYSSAKDAITVELHFDSGKGTLTPAEAIAMRDAISELNKRDDISLIWDNRGAKLLAAGKMKEGFEEERAEIAANPKSAITHARYARALLQAGVGDLAKKEAEAGVALDPKSTEALSALGWVSEHDAFGKRFGRGYDRARAIAVFEQLVPLRTPYMDPRFDLAVLYEFDAQGRRYRDQAGVAKAIEIYKSVIAEKKDTGADLSDYQKNLAYALLAARRYAELDELLPKLPSTTSRNGIMIVSAVAQKDVAAGLRAADATRMNTQERGQALANAGAYLAQLGMYSQAAEILQAAVTDSNGAQVARQIEVYRNLKRLPDQIPAVGDATDPVRQMLDLVMTGSATRESLSAVMSRHAYATPKAFDLNIEKGMQAVGLLHSLAERTGSDEAVLRDVVMGGYTMKVSGSDADGYRIIGQPLGANPQHFFVAKEDGAFKIVADDNDENEVGNFALYALDHKQNALAKSILDWKRELQHKGGGDDSFSGPMLPRFWTVGSTKEGADSPEAMRLAALSLLSTDISIASHLKELVAIRDKSTGQRQADVTLLLAKGYVAAEQPSASLPLIEKLTQDDPDSETLLNLSNAAYAMEGDIPDWRKMLDGRLAKKPADADLLRAKSHMLIAAGDFAGSRTVMKSVLESGKETSNDYNSFAWSGLFDNTLTPEIVEAAQKSNMMSKNASFGDLHTLASIYAAMGKTTEARQVLKQANEAGNLSQPNSAVWYVLGLIYEQYGLHDAAVRAYRNVQRNDFSEHTFIDPGSSYNLAQSRLKVLGAM